MQETPAKGKKGFILYSPIDKKFFFRIYKDTKDANGHKEFTDYKICAEDFEVEIMDNFVSFYEVDGTKILDYSSKALGKGIKS